MEHMLQEADDGNGAAIQASKHFISLARLKLKKVIIREHWGTVPSSDNLLPPDLEPVYWSTVFGERLARFVRTGISRSVGEADLRFSMEQRIAAHRARGVGYIERLSPNDVTTTIARVFPAGTSDHLDLCESLTL